MATCSNGNLREIPFEVPSHYVIWKEIKNVSVIPCRVSSGLHERCNDLSTLLITDSVKLNYRSRCRLPVAGQEDPVELYCILTLVRIVNCVV